MINLHYYPLPVFLVEEKEHKTWIKTCLKSLKKEHKEINYIFLNKEEHLKLNKEVFNHNYDTDIITIDNRELSSNSIETDIYINIDIVIANSKEYNTTNLNELKRVMIHGILHLCGYNDKTKEEQKEMTKCENKYINIFVPRETYG